MLTSVEIYGSRVSPPILALDPAGGPDTDPIQILGVNGLEPVKANINSTPFAEVGESYNGSSVGKRNIVFTIGLNPNWHTQTFESLRHLLYQYFMPQLPVRMVFKSTHLPDCQISGYVETCDPNIFSKDPQFLVSVICPEPFFVAIGKSVVSGTVGDGSNPIDIDYIGTVPTGFKIIVNSSAARPSYDGAITIQQIAPRAVDFTASAKVDADGSYEMSSIRGAKYVRRTTSPPVNVLNTVPGASPWPELYAGKNKIAVRASQSGQLWQLEYFSRFGGL